MICYSTTLDTALTVSITFLLLFNYLCNGFINFLGDEFHKSRFYVQCGDVCEVLFFYLLEEFLQNEEDE